MLFHDLLRLPILHHYVWSEITGHISLQKIVDLAHPDPLTPAKNYMYVPYSNLYSGVSVIYCHCQIQLLSEFRKPLGLSHSCSTEGRTLDLQYLLVVHVNALNRSTKYVTLTTNYTFDVAVY